MALRIQQDLSLSKKWIASHLVTLESQTILLGWVEEKSSPLLIVPMEEQEETSIESIWSFSERLISAFSTDLAFAPWYPNERPQNLRLFLGIVASDSSIAYYAIEKKSLAQVDLAEPNF